MRKAPYLIALAATFFTGCDDDRLHGKIVQDDSWRNSSGSYYGIVLESEGDSTFSYRPFVFVGADEEINNLDRRYNPGDSVALDAQESTAFTLLPDGLLVQVLWSDLIENVERD